MLCLIPKIGLTQWAGEVLPPGRNPCWWLLLLGACISENGSAGCISGLMEYGHTRCPTIHYEPSPRVAIAGVGSRKEPWDKLGYATRNRRSDLSLHHAVWRCQQCWVAHAYSAMWMLKYGLENTKSGSLGPTDTSLLCSVAIATKAEHSLQSQTAFTWLSCPFRTDRYFWVLLSCQTLRCLASVGCVRVCGCC